jgi:8-oxo-dGTP diphosphatase
MDDARALDIYTLDSLPEPLAFDHALILEDYRRYLAMGQTAPLRLA